MSLELEQIVDRCRSNDPSALPRLWEQVGGKVFALCYRMLGQRQDAEDAAQETFFRATRYLGRWDSRRAFEPWLLTIAANRCRSILARRQRQPTWERLLEDPPSQHAPSKLQARDQLLEEVDRALTRMRPEWEQAFRLFHEQELSYMQIAHRLGCPVGTVKTWVHRARGELARQLQARAVVER